MKKQKRKHTSKKPKYTAKEQALLDALDTRITKIQKQHDLVNAEQSHLRKERLQKLAQLRKLAGSLGGLMSERDAIEQEAFDRENPPCTKCGHRAAH